jgi:hypothetical protein
VKYTANDMGTKGATGNSSKMHRLRVEKKSGMHRVNKYKHGRKKGRGRK